MTIVAAEQRLGENGGAVPALSAELRERYCTLLRRLPWPGNDPAQGVRAVGVTSCCSGEGVSTVAAQLAVTAASCGERRVLLVDAHAARPAVHAAFGVPLAPGLSEVACNAADLSTAVRPSALGNLWLLPAGHANGQPFPDYGLPAWDEIVAAVRQDYQLIVFDMPAARQTSAVIALARLLDGVLLVIEAERLGHDVLLPMKEMLLESDVRLLGAVLNKRRQYVPAWLHRML